MHVTNAGKHFWGLILFKQYQNTSGSGTDNTDESEIILIILGKTQI